MGTVRVAGALAIGALTAACSGPAYYAPTEVRRALYPGLTDKTDDEIRAALDAELELVEPLAAGLIWVDQQSEGPGRRLERAGWDSYERSGVLHAAVEVLTRPPFASVSPVPTVRAAPGPGDVIPDLRGLRSAAAQLQDDVAIVLQTTVYEPFETNPLAITWIALAPMWFAPGLDLVTYASAEACALDVRSGVLLACATGRASAEDRYVLMWSSREAEREVRERAITGAVDLAARRLAEGVRGRIQ